MDVLLSVWLGKKNVNRHIASAKWLRIHIWREMKASWPMRVSKTSLPLFLASFPHQSPRSSEFFSMTMDGMTLDFCCSQVQSYRCMPPHPAGMLSFIKTQSALTEGLVDQLPKQETLYNSLTLTLSPESSLSVNSPFNSGRPSSQSGTYFEKHTHDYKC